MDLTVRCCVVDCPKTAVALVRWQAGLVPACEDHLLGQVSERPVG